MTQEVGSPLVKSSGASESPVSAVAFESLRAKIDISFWKALASKKLKEWQSQTPWVWIGGIVSSSHGGCPTLEIDARTCGLFGDQGPDQCSLSSTSCSSNGIWSGPRPGSIGTLGIFVNFNTLKDFELHVRSSSINHMVRRCPLPPGTHWHMNAIAAADCVSRESHVYVPSVAELFGAPTVKSGELWNTESHTSFHRSPCAFFGRFILMCYWDMVEYEASYAIAFPQFVPTSPFVHAFKPAACLPTASLSGLSVGEGRRAGQCAFLPPGTVEMLEDLDTSSSSRLSFTRAGVFVLRIHPDGVPPSAVPPTTCGSTAAEDTGKSSVDILPIGHLFGARRLATVNQRDSAVSSWGHECESACATGSLVQGDGSFFVIAFLDVGSTSDNPSLLAMNLWCGLADSFNLWGLIVPMLAVRDPLMRRRGSPSASGHVPLSREFVVKFPAAPSSGRHQDQALTGLKSTGPFPTSSVRVAENEHGVGVAAPGCADTTCIRIEAGWLYPSQNRTTMHPPSLPPSAFVVRLRDFLDPDTLQRSAVDLHVQLIKWRTVPEFEPRTMQDLKVLVLGAGTLGCSISRLLVAWGTRHITFVDNGRVSWSNPTRQSLYTAEDSKCGGYKALEAAARLREVCPSVNTTGVVLEIPVPGHPIQAANATKEQHDKLLSLIDTHDVVFLLTDTRESRWLPSLMVAYRQLHPCMETDVSSPPASSHHSCSTFNAPSSSSTSPVYSTPVNCPSSFSSPCPSPSGCISLGHTTSASSSSSLPSSSNPNKRPPPVAITVALGFDSAVVMRHGYPGHASSLGCYFCNDLAGPRDSTSERPLDQRCTVTRPGCAALASALAVELLASLAQHPEGFAAAHSTQDKWFSPQLRPIPEQPRTFEDRKNNSVSCLGATPHTIRLELATFRIRLVQSEQFESCICCSRNIIEAYASAGIQIVQKAVENSTILEEISGLSAMKAATRAEEVLCLDYDDAEL